MTPVLEYGYIKLNAIRKSSPVSLSAGKEKSCLSLHVQSNTRFRLLSCRQLLNLFLNRLYHRSFPWYHS